MAMKKLVCGIVYSVFALCCSVNGAFVTSPNNVAELTNNAVVLTCTTDSTSGISWSYLPIGSSSLTPIAPVCKVGAEFQSVYHTEGPASDVCKLMVNNTQLTNAGTYLCQEVSTSRFSTAQLVVLEPLTSSVNVTTSTAAESDVVEFTCSVGFNSSQIIPSIRWTSGGDAVSRGVVTTSPANLKLSVYRVTAGTSHLPSYKCEVYFTPTTVTAPTNFRGASVDQNTPTYTDSQTFAPITVTYCPRNVALESGVINGSTVAGGTVLRCSAAGNPSPTFRWTNSTGDVDVTGPTFTVEVNTFYVLTCTATNTITHSDGRQQTCSNSYTVFFNTTVVAPTTSEPSTSALPPGSSVSTTQSTGPKSDNLPLILGLSVGLGGALIILIFILLFCCCCPCCPLYDQCRKDKQNRGDREGPYADARGDVRPTDDYSLANTAYQDKPLDAYYRPDVVNDSKLPPTDYRGSPYNQPVSPGGVVYAELQVPSQPRSRTPVVEPSNTVYGTVVSA